jgi:hypothetical protein
MVLAHDRVVFLRSSVVRNFVCVDFIGSLDLFIHTGKVEAVVDVAFSNPVLGSSTPRPCPGSTSFTLKVAVAQDTLWFRDDILLHRVCYQGYCGDEG